MWSYEKRLQFPVRIKTPNAAAAKVIITQYGGPDGELGASMRYLSQRYTMPWRGVAGLLTDIGTEELAHLEMVSAIVYQLTKGLSADEIRRQGFDTYFVDHTAGVWPQAAGGTPFTSMCFASKGDAITDLHECCFSERMRKLFRKNEKSVLRFCNKSSKTKRAFTKVLMPCKRPF